MPKAAKRKVATKSLFPEQLVVTREDDHGDVFYAAGASVDDISTADGEVVALYRLDWTGTVMKRTTIEPHLKARA